jgi:hypothetical protein
VPVSYGSIEVMEIKLHVIYPSAFYSVPHEVQGSNDAGGGGSVSVTSARDGRLNVTITLHSGQFPLLPTHL